MKAALGKSVEMEKYYQILVKNGYFTTLRDVMLFAIAIGFKNEERMVINKYGGDPIKEHLFKDEMDFLNIIALLTTKDISILLNENKEEKYKLLEEYAEAGMNLFVKETFIGDYITAEKILTYVQKYAPDGNNGKVDLSNLLGQLMNEIDIEEQEQIMSLDLREDMNGGKRDKSR